MFEQVPPTPVDGTANWKYSVAVEDAPCIKFVFIPTADVVKSVFVPIAPVAVEYLPFAAGIVVVPGPVQLIVPPTLMFTSIYSFPEFVIVSVISAELAPKEVVAYVTVPSTLKAKSVFISNVSVDVPVALLSSVATMYAVQFVAECDVEVVSVASA